MTKLAEHSREARYTDFQSGVFRQEFQQSSQFFRYHIHFGLLI